MRKGLLRACPSKCGSSATAYYLATRHRITNVAVIERSYIGGGNSGRNTTIIRANYGIPEAVRFYQHSVDLYATLERETERELMHKTKGLLWIAHSEAGIRQERARAEINTACGATTEYVDPQAIKEICPSLVQAAQQGYGRTQIRQISLWCHGPQILIVRSKGSSSRCT